MDEDFKLLAVKYITGQANDLEASKVNRWIKESPENEICYIQLYELWHHSLLAGKDSIDTDKAYENFRAGTSRSVLFLRGWYLKAAIAAILFCICGMGFYQLNTRLFTKSLLEVNVQKGATRKLTLPDGTNVWINAGSVLKYSKNFGKQDRTVYLEGEAYFDIAKSITGIPFLVKAAEFTIRDVGTIFNVKSYPNEEVFETTVVEGQVSVEGKLEPDAEENKIVFLNANQVLKIDVGKVKEKKYPGNKNIPSEPVRVMQISASQQNEYHGWKDDLLVFEEDTFEDIARVLERKYNVNIVFSDEGFKSYTYTGTFKNIESVLKVFQVIKENTPIDYKINGSLITIVKASKPIYNKLN